MRPTALAVIAALLIPSWSCAAQEKRSASSAAATRSAARFPFLEIDVKARRVAVECEALHVETPLEFFVCSTGTNEHEAVLRSKVRPSHLHAALLMLGLEPGEPVHYSEAQQKWIPPHGPPLHLTVQFEKDGKPDSLPAHRLMRDIRSKRDMPPTTWIFAGSRMLPGDAYAADRTGYLVSVVNFDFSVIDIPQLASNANETLQWQTNLDRMPPAGTEVMLIIEPAGKIEGARNAEAEPAAPIDQALIKIDPQGQIELDGQAVASAQELPALLKRDGPARRVRVAVANTVEENPTAREVMNALSAANIRFNMILQSAAIPTTRPANAAADVRADEALIKRLREQWNTAVAPHDASLREAARTHYQVIGQLRREQQRLIDEADKVQRLIDELERKYQDMTTPRAE
jgi:hypothetical protein